MCSDLTHNGSGIGIVRCPSAKFRHIYPLPGLCIHIAYSNLLKREPSRLRRIGVDSPVKLAERRSLDTALLQQGATVVRQFAHLP